MVPSRMVVKIPSFRNGQGIYGMCWKGGNGLEGIVGVVLHSSWRKILCKFSGINYGLGGYDILIPVNLFIHSRLLVLQGHNLYPLNISCFGVWSAHSSSLNSHSSPPVALFLGWAGVQDSLLTLAWRSPCSYMFQIVGEGKDVKNNFGSSSKKQNYPQCERARQKKKEKESEKIKKRMNMDSWARPYACRLHYRCVTLVKLLNPSGFLWGYSNLNCK